ncbi:MAG: hypothetical protein JXA67_09660 [Micromonosporaceae bacterium]|nr:hypothetical protein [Micromonosporaceae bacterium]
MTAYLPPWSEILATALVGTQRRAVPLPDQHDGGHLPGDPAVALLELAAVIGSCRRAAMRPRVLPPQRLPAPPAVAGQRLLPAPPAAVARLAELLAPGSKTRQHGPLRDAAARIELLAEWLARAAGNSMEVPGELVPALLDVGRRNPLIRPLIAPAAGERAAWLAAQRAEWAYHHRAVAGAPAGGPVDHHDRATWELGTIGQRVAYLTALRAADPRAASCLLAAEWDDQTPDDRAALLPALAARLSTGDEPLLERALRDRRPSIRATAGTMLVALPGSGYARRMAGRATACVDARGAGTVLVTPPAGCDEGMRRDGIAVRPPAGVGQRAWLLEEVLARTPLGIWPGPPEHFLRRPVTEGWAVVLHRGLARASIAARDADWAIALVAVLAACVRAGERPDDRLLVEALYDVLPAEEIARIAADTLAGGLADAGAVGIERLLELCPRPWPDAVTEAFLAALEAGVATRRAGAWRVTGLCEMAALRLPTATLDRVAAIALLAASGARPRDPIVAATGRLASTLRYRSRMLEELL